MTKRALMLAFSLAIPALAAAQSAPPTASLDRTKAEFGETVTLNVELNDIAPGTFDPSPLMADFVVLGTSVQSSTSNVNGQSSRRAILGIALRPLHEGHLTVPSIAIGSQRTPPLELDVTPASDASAGAVNRPVMLEGKVDSSKAYVGQQLDYTLRLYFPPLSDGALGDPAADGAEVRRVGQDANYETVRGGRRLNVLERHYAIFPQHAGPLDIQAPTFQGAVVDPGDAGSFFGAGSPVSASAERVRVDVRARPAGATDGAWIPARELKLSLEGMPADGKARVGQPLTLTMHLDAVGVPYEALPDLSLPAIEGAEVYPDKPVTGGSINGPWVTGRRQRAFAVVPSRSGTLHIPETTLHWWNVVADKAETAVVPAQDIQVAPGAVVAGASPRGDATPGVSEAPAVATAPAAATFPWRWLFFGALGLWLLTLVGWVLHARGRRAAPLAKPVTPAMPATRERPAREAFLASVGAGDPAAIERRLVAWARVVRPSILNTGVLAKALRPGVQREAIGMLERARFAGAALDGDSLKQAFGKGFDWLPPTEGTPTAGLPPLYPR